MHIETDITGETHSVHKREGQRVPHFIISGCGIERLDKRKIREYLDGCDWTDRACPAWFPATMLPDDFMKAPRKRRGDNTQHIKQTTEE